MNANGLDLPRKDFKKQVENVVRQTMLPFTPNESSLETLASLRVIAVTGTRCRSPVAVRLSAPLVGFQVFPITHVNNGAASVNNLGIYCENRPIFRRKITKMRSDIKSSIPVKLLVFAIEQTR